MSQEIDQRIVAMQFDNQQFESGVATSIGTLKRLKTALRMDHASDGLDDLSRSVKSFDMSGLASAVDLINQRFSMLGMMGMTVLHRLTNEAINAGHRLLNAITMAPVKSGFQEYETQINAIQTILANTSSKGTTLDQVNAALDELNHYADMTIYNFTQMTRNIGTFTAAGVDLDTSVAAIKGIANLAAVSGSTSQQASTAMYQLSQAIASGTVKLQDWNSVVNAGMGGQVFQNALMETARLHKIKIDELVKKKGSFRETLSTGWLTSEILTETLKKFTGDLSKEQLIQMGYTEAQADSIYQLGITANDAATKVKTVTQLFDTLGEALQSGWTQSWEWIIGDFEEAKELLTSISDVLSEKINESASKRNLLLEGWSKGGGRYMMIGGFREFARGLAEVAGSVQQAWKDIFPDITVTNLLRISGGFRKMMIAFHQALSKPRGENGKSILDYVQSAFRGVFSVGKIALDGLKQVGKGALSLLGGLAPLGMKIVETAGSIGDWLTSLYEQVRDSKSLKEFGENVSAAFKPLLDALPELWDKGVAFVKSVLNSDGFKNMLTVVKTFFKSLLTSIPAAIQKVKEFCGSLWESIRTSKAVKNWSTNLKAFFAPLSSWFDGVRERLDTTVQNYKRKLASGEGLSLSGIFSDLGHILGLDTLWSKITASPIYQTLSDYAQRIFGPIGDWFSNFGAQLHQKFQEYKAKLEGGKGISLSDIFSDLGSLLGLDKAWANLQNGSAFQQISEKLQKVIGPALTWLTNTWNRIKERAAQLLSQKGGDMEKGGFFATLGAWLTASYEWLKEKFDQFKGWIGGVFQGIGEWISSIDLSKFFAFATSIVSIINMFQIGRMIGGLGSTFKQLGGVLKNLRTGGLKGLKEGSGGEETENWLDKIGKNLLRIAGAIAAIVGIMYVLSKMDFETIRKGMTRLGTLMLYMFVFSLAMGQTNLGDTGKQLLLLAAALTVMLIPIKAMANMAQENWYTALVRLFEVLVILGGFMKLVSGTKLTGGKGSGSGSMLALAVALNLLLIPIAVLGNMDVGKLAQGIFALAVIMGVLGETMQLIDQKAIGKSSGMIAMAIALNLLLIPIAVLGNMKLENLAQGVIALAGIMAALAGTMWLLNKAGSQDKGGVGKLVISVLLLGGLIALFTECLKSVQNIPAATIASFGGSIAGMMLAIAGAMRILSKLSMGDIVKGGAALFVGVTAIGGAVALVAEMVGKAVGDVAEDLFEGTLSISHIGEAGKKIDQRGIEKVKTAAETLATMMGDIVLTDTSGFDAMSGRLVLFGGRLALFNLNVGGIQENAANNAVKMVKDIATMAETLSGLIDPGDQKNALANTIANVGAAISLYNDDVSGITITPDDTTNASNIAAFIGELDKMLPRSDTLGRLTEINQQGEKLGGLNATSFGIVNIATALQKYAKVAEGVNPENMNNVTGALDKLAELQEKLGPADENPIIRWFTGKKQTLGDFAAALISLGNGLNSFYGSMAYVTTSSGKVEEVNLDKLGNATKIVDELVKIAGKLPANSGVVSLLSSANFGTFGVQVEALGTHLAGFANSISGATLDEAKIDSMVAILERLVTANNKLTFGNYSFDDLFEGLLDCQDTLNTLTTDLESANLDDMVKFSEAVRSLASAFSILFTIPNVSGDSSRITTLMSVFANASIPEFSASGAESATTYFAAFLAESQNGLVEVGRLVTVLVATLNAQRFSFQRAGAYAAQGFANGIRQGCSSAIKAATELAASAVKAAQQRLDEHSPSKETAKLGQYFSLGLAEGISEYSYAAKQSAGSMSQEALDAVKAELAALASVPMDGIDTSPVIRPVVDLSDVNAGASTIASLMQMQSGIQLRGVMAGVATENVRAVNEQNRNTDTSGLLREMQAINAKMDSFSAQLANMKVVLDSGELVGGIQNKVDSALGRSAKLRERG